jgi:hypothetical protein
MGKLETLISDPIGQRRVLAIPFRYLTMSLLLLKSLQFFKHVFPLRFLWIPVKSEPFETVDTVLGDFGLAGGPV